MAKHLPPPAHFSIIDPDKIPDGYVYNSFGKILSSKQITGRSIHDNTGQVLLAMSGVSWVVYTYDHHGRELTQMRSNGAWGEHVYDDARNSERFTNSTGFWEEIDRDSNGLAIYKRDSDGNWLDIKTLRDENGVITGYIDYQYTAASDITEVTHRNAKRAPTRISNSLGWWHETTYDDKGNTLSIRSSSDPSALHVRAAPLKHQQESP